MADTRCIRLSSALYFLALILNIQFKFGFCFSTASGRILENEGYQYTIDEPTFQWDGFRLNIDYKFSASVADEIITYAIVSDNDCDGGIISDTEIESSLIEVSNNSVRLSLLLDPENIHGARYVTHQENFAIVGVCARLWINQASSSPEDEIVTVSAPRDDYIMIEADLEDLKGISNILDDNSLDWGVDTFQCDDRNQEVVSPPALRNGEKLRLCLKPTTRTRDDGVYLSLIKSFHFSRDGVIQKAAATYGTDEVTKVECNRGSDLCVIESVLSNDFFHSPGEVKAEGVLFLQYGYEEKRKHRSLRSVQVNLQSSTNMRSLYDYERGEIVSEKTTEYLVNINPMNKVYSAEAFRCDESNNPIKKKSLNERESLKLCVQPDEEAIDAGVYINSMESFSYGRANDDKIQIAVDSYGRVADDNRTQVECINGATKCSINSTLEDWFFDEDITMVVTGYVILQFGARNQGRRTRIVYRDLDESSNSDLGFAGRSQVDAFFDTVGKNSVDEKGPVENWIDNLFDKWDLSDTDMTILYIVAAVLFILICLCCCAGCLFLFYIREEKKEEPRSTMQHINIKIQDRDRDNSNSTDVRAGSNSRDDDSDDSENEDVIPGENDICFDAEEHPGTEAFLAAVQQTLENLGPVPYSPAVYKHIKRQLSNRQFYLCDQDNNEKNDENNDDGTDNQYEWREASKRELIDLFWKYYEEEKSQML